MLVLWFAELLQRHVPGRELLVTRRWTTVGVFGLAWLLVGAGLARADSSDVDRGRELLQEADFEGALAAFEQAEAAGGLDRDCVVRMLEGRVLAHHGLGHRGAMEQALVALAALDPEHAFGPEVPPEVRERFVQLAGASDGALGVRVSLLRGGQGLTLVARPLRAPPGLVRQVRLLARVGEEGAWKEGTGSVDLPEAESSDPVAWLVELVGPGGAVLLRDEGTATLGQPPTEATVTQDGVEDEETPEQDASATGEAGPLREAPPRPDESDGGSGGLWIGLGVGAVAVVGAVVAAVLLTSGGSDQTEVQPPIVEGF